MDLSLEAIKLPAWDPASAAEWDEAFEKVENYLRACRVASRLHRARLTALILQRAIERRAATFPSLGKNNTSPFQALEKSAASGQLLAVSQQSSSLNPHHSSLPLATLAIEEARELIANWLANLLPAAGK